MQRPTIIPPDVIHADREKYPDSIELGKAGSRLTVRFNADDPEEALRRVDEAFVVRDYAINALMMAEEAILKKRK